MSDRRRFTILNIAVVIVVVGNLIGGMTSLFTGQDYYFICLSVWCVSGFMLAIFHGGHLLGWKNILIVCIIGSLYSLFFESTAINFGWWFSQYTYTSVIPGPKIFGFDVVSVIAYGLIVYISWAVAQAVAGQFDNKFRKGDVVLIPIIATMFTAALDYATDPIMATIGGSYIWHGRGVFFGIPFQNYVGWYIFAYAMYQSFALILYFQARRGKLRPQPEIAGKKQFWYYPLLIFAANTIQCVFYAFIGNDKEVVNGFGQVFLANDIYKGVLIAYMGAFFAPCFMSLVRVYRAKELE